MKKLLLLLLCVPLIFSCGEKKDNDTEEGESNKEKLHNTETANSRIEVDESGEIYLRNISKNEKFEFTLSVFYENCKLRYRKEYWPIKSYPDNNPIAIEVREKYPQYHLGLTDEELKSEFTLEELQDFLDDRSFRKLYPEHYFNDTVFYKLIESTNGEEQFTITLNPGQREKIGSGCTDAYISYAFFSVDYASCECYDSTPIKYSVMGELKIE